MKTYKSGLTPKQFMASMDEYYGNEDLYGYGSKEFYKQDGFEDILRALRTPVNRSVEFYVAKVAQGEPAVVSDNAQIIQPIKDFNKWSNAGSLRQVVKRQLALYGDAFQRIVIEDNKVYKEHLDTRFVTDFEEDNRGNLLELRIDIPIDSDNGNPQTYTEYWDKYDGYMVAWIHQGDDNTELSELTDSDIVSYMLLSQLGIDFIPVRHTKFKDIGEKWGANCVQHAIHKIDEANRVASYLNETYFGYGKPTTAVFRSEVLPDGTPLPPVDLDDVTSGGTNRTQYTVNSSQQVKFDAYNNPIQVRTLRQILDGLRTVYLPGMTDIKYLNTEVNFDAGLNIVTSTMEELEKDLPEERYYSLPVKDLSSIAIRQYLGAALDRASEAQSNLITDEIRLNEMALTIGNTLGIFSVAGNYDNGSFTHNLNFAPIFDNSDREKADVLSTLSPILGVELALQLAGYDASVVDKYMTSQESVQ